MEGDAGGNPDGIGRGRARGRSTHPSFTRSTPRTEATRSSSSPSSSSTSSNGNGNGSGSAHDDGNGNGNGHAQVPVVRSGLEFVPRDMFRSRPDELNTKKGTLGQPINLVANYYALNIDASWRLYKHHVFFPDELDHKPLKLRLIRDLGSTIGPNNFDGSTLISMNRLVAHNESEVRYIASHPDPTKEPIPLRVVQVGTLSPADPMLFQFFNNVIRKCLKTLKLTEIRRNFFEPELRIPFDQYRIELWPGLVTSVRRHENATLMCVDVTHKVLYQDNIFHAINEIQRQSRSPQEAEKAIVAELVGRICMTMYNKKTYRIDDVDFKQNPLSTFPTRSGNTSFVEYYKTRYQMDIKIHRQPLLVSNPRLRDIHRNQGPALLIPELCQLTGLTEQMRSDFNLMKAMDQYLQMVPHTRTTRINQFRQRLNLPEIRNEITTWGINFDQNLIEVRGRKLPVEDIVFARDEVFKPSPKSDWDLAFRDRKSLYSVQHLQEWIVLSPYKSMANARSLVQTMKRVSQPIGFNIADPREFIEIRQTNPNGYSDEVNQAIVKYKGRVQLVFVVLTHNSIERYAAVKRVCYSQHGVSSQCFVERNLNKNNQNMSVATKVVVQMAAKLGGIPWLVKVPMKNIMVVGYDVHHPAGSGTTWGAMVASTTNVGRFFSTVSKHGNREELSRTMKEDFSKCLRAYEQVTGNLPDRIFFYRDGVGEGQLFEVYNEEITDSHSAIKSVYDQAKKAEPKFIFIVVTKKINTKFFINNRGGMENPPPGTLVDDVVTLPERYDFYMIAQAGRKGTVTPTSFNVLYDKMGLNADKIHVFTYKMTHLYYNWTGTLAVPAVCQYAHKLAFLVGKATQQGSHRDLSHLLYYL